MLTIKRSPAKVCWHVLCNGILIDIGHTKQEANELLAKYKGLM